MGLKASGTTPVIADFYVQSVVQGLGLWARLHPAPSTQDAPDANAEYMQNSDEAEKISEASRLAALTVDRASRHFLTAGDVLLASMQWLQKQPDQAAGEFLTSIGLSQDRGGTCWLGLFPDPRAPEMTQAKVAGLLQTPQNL